MPTPTPEGFQARLKEARERAGLTLREAALRLGCQHPWLAELEGGRRAPSLEWARRLANLYAVSLDWLAGRSDA